MKKFLTAALGVVLCAICTAVPVKAEVIYAPEVEKEAFEEAGAYTIDGTGEHVEVTVPKTDKTEAVGEGDRIVLPGNEENPVGAALLVNGVTEDAEGLHYICEEADTLSDFVESIDIGGYGELLPQQAKGGAASVKARGIGVDIGNTASNAGRIDYRFEDTFLEGGAVLNGAVSVEISSIEYRLKMDIGRQETRVEDFYFAVNHTVNIDADVMFTAGGTAAGGELMLGTVPFVLGASGIGGELAFWLEYDVNGNLNVAYTLSNLAGVAYENGACRPFAENHQAIAALAGVRFSAGPKMQFTLNFGGNMKLFDMTVRTGLSGTADAASEGFGAGETGYGVDTYAYLSLCPGEEGLINRTLKLKQTELWNAGNSPFHKTLLGAF